MQLKIPPALQAFIFGLSMWIIDKYFTIGNFTFIGQKITAKIIFFVGILITFLAILSFKKAKTTSDPTNPSKATSLVTNGIYKYSRNPMYLTIVIVLFSWMIALGNVFNVIILFIFVYYITTYQIKPEEEALTKLFGEDYRLYCKKVRRWI